jgi:PAS domain S-box-containing protein
VDITERKLAEAALLEIDRVLRESQVIAGLGSYLLNVATGEFSSSAVLDEMFGISVDSEHTLASWSALVHPEDRAAVVDYFQNDVLGQGRRFNREFRIIRPNDQAERWVHGLGRLEFDPERRPLAIYGTVQDITERKQAEAALRQSELRYRAIFESSRDALFIADSDSGMLVDANPAAQTLAGCSLVWF